MYEILRNTVLKKKKALTIADIMKSLTSEESTIFEQPDVDRGLVVFVLDQESGKVSGDIQKTKKGKKNYYKLRVSNPPQNKKKPSTDSNDSSEIGKAGEYAVMTECIAAGYNASLMAVDKGIDIVASKSNVFYYIQVKTSYLDDKGRFSVHIPADGFRRASQYGNVVYIAVVRDWIGKFKFFIFHERDISILIRQGCIEETDSNIIIKIMYNDLNEPIIYNGKDSAKAVAYLAGMDDDGGRFVL